MLGFVMAAVAILAAFGPRAGTSHAMQGAERRFARARGHIIVSLLATGAFLLVLLVTASLALATDTKPDGNPFVLVVLLGSAVASTVGLMLSGLGLSLAVIERSKGHSIPI
ncbi:hypothetical protein Asi02nite_48160 [Asanoa siamensis]|uniref:Uncharacterized protein n=1 Tax=Asanoa siamensis TaxID=926357 RepID=A0ABQ4CVH8_9ACTN|nr:hypothetical protein Asi02nite_48160 [Asanoa siamensis]